MVWIQFAVCAVLILVSGGLLSRYADMLAEKTKMGRIWIGLILLATITSLPELGTGISAVTIASAPNIAVGAVLGSCVFNLMLIGLIDLVYRPMPILSKVDQGHTLSAGFGIVLIGMAIWGLVLESMGFSQWRLWIGPYTPLILVIYITAIRRVFEFERKRMATYLKVEVKALKYSDVPVQYIYGNLALHGIVVIVAGSWLAFIGIEIAEVTQWGSTLVGSLFIAASTSLPEIVTSFTALRLAAPDLAIANLFGSNLFNMVILAIDDIFYLEGPLLSQVSSFHLLSGVAALIMTGIGITGLVYRTQKNAWFTLSWDGTVLLVLYILNAYLLFVLGRGPDF